MYAPQLLYSSLWQWKFRLLPFLGYCKLHFNEHWGVCILLDVVFLWIYAKSVISGPYGSSIFSFLKNLHSVLNSGLTNCHFHQQCRSVPFSPHLLQHDLLADYFEASHFDLCEVISHCSFDLHFSNN